MEEARDRVYDVVDELIGCNLLLPGEEKKRVTLHDVVRDVCISIASKSDNVNIFSKFDDLSTKLYGLKSHSLRLLRLVNEGSFWKSRYLFTNKQLEETENKEMKFYEEMQKLRVLEVNHITTSLPSSLQFMFNLQTLSLDHCRLKGDFAGIGSLKMLRVLSFFHSIIEIFPMEIAELTNLQCLDLRFHFNVPNTLPLGTLSRLNKLEELYLGDHVLNDRESLKVFGSLSKLHTIQSVVNDSCMEVLLKNMNLSKLTRFYIQWASYELIGYEIRENVLLLNGKNVDVDIYLLKILMQRTEWFELNGDGLGNVVDILGEDNGYKNLRMLKLNNCDMKYLVDATNHDLPNGIFGKLEELKIRDASQLEELIHGDHQLETLCSRIHEVNSLQYPLGNLRELDIYYCDKIKSLFSKSMVNCLRNLERIDVHECPKLERIITSREDEGVDRLEVYQFQSLRRLELAKVPGFRSFGPQPGLMLSFHQSIFPELEHLWIRLCDSVKKREGEAEQLELCSYLGCSLPNVRKMEISQCNNLFSIANSGLLHGFQELEKLEVSNCLSLEVLFDFEVIMCLSIAEYEETTLLGRLEKLDLKSLPKLKNIWRMLPKEIPSLRNLKIIKVVDCGSLRYLLTPTVANMLVNLEEISLEDNKLMEAVIGRDGNDMPNDGDEFILRRIVLPKLKSLYAKRLPSFRKLCSCSPDLILELPSLSELSTTIMVEDILARDQISRLTSLSLSRINGRRYPLTPPLVELFVHIQELNLGGDICNNEMIEAIIGSDHSDATKSSIVFPQLRQLKIKNLRNLRKLCSSPDLILELPSLIQLQITDSAVDLLTTETHAFQNLKKVKIMYCGSFKYLPTSSAQVLVHLKEMELHNNGSMEAIFGYESSDKEEIPNNTIVLPKLRRLVIWYLDNFKMLCCSSNVNVELPSLTEFCIVECDKMTRLCAGQLSIPQLQHVTYGLIEQKIGVETFVNSWLKDRESMIRCFECNYTRSETCDHLDYESKESEYVSDEVMVKMQAIKEVSSNATRTSEEESLVMNTQN